MVLDVAAAPLQHLGHLSVDGVEAELRLGPPLRRAARRLLQLQLGRVGKLQRLQQARLTIYKVGDGVHGQTALQRKELLLTFQIKSYRRKWNNVFFKMDVKETRPEELRSRLLSLNLTSLSNKYLGS